MGKLSEGCPEKEYNIEKLCCNCWPPLVFRELGLTKKGDEGNVEKDDDENNDKNARTECPRITTGKKNS